ncbi:Major facilitator superfamily domain-containing protein 9, partial [Globisporangium splendens]
MASLSAWLQRRVLYVVSFLDLLAVSMIIPSLSSYVKSMDGGALAFGGIMSMYGFIQFFAAPIAGSLSDVYGRRRVLQVCFVGASSGYLLLGLSWNIYMVILSRIPSALFKHTLDIIKVAVTDAEDPKFRSAAIGNLNAASSAGFIIGPIVGGYVSSVPNGFNYTTLLTTALFGVNYALVSVFFHDHQHLSNVSSDVSLEKAASSAKSSSSVDWRRLLLNAKNKLFEFQNIFYETGPAKTLLVARLLLAMAAILYRTHFSTLLEDKFGTDSKSRGFVLSYMGFLGAFGSVSVGLATKMIKSERLLLQLSSIIYVLTFVLLSKATTIKQIYIILIPQVVSISMLRASSIALQTTFVSQERVGAFMGISSSLTVLLIFSTITSGSLK